jgi:hypothetical protein
MKSRKLFLAFNLLVVIGLALSACGVNVERNPDGSLKVEANIAAGGLQAEIAAAIADPLMQDFTVDLRNGYIFVSAERKRMNSDVTDTLTFRLGLGVSDGHLAATISETQLNGRPVDEERVAVWNERIGTRLERAGKRNSNSILQAVNIDPDALTMIWRVETARSRGE